MLDNGETLVRKAADILGRNANREAKQTQACKVNVPGRAVKTTIYHRLQETTTEDGALPLRIHKEPKRN